MVIIFVHIVQINLVKSELVYCGNVGFGSMWQDNPFWWLFDPRDQKKAIKEFESKFNIKVSEIKPLKEYY